MKIKKDIKSKVGRRPSKCSGSEDRQPADQIEALAGNCIVYQIAIILPVKCPRKGGSDEYNCQKSRIANTALVSAQSRTYFSNKKEEHSTKTKVRKEGLNEQFSRLKPGAKLRAQA